MDPVFIIGSPRSGTSMLHWSLAQHPGLWGGAESDFLCVVAESANRAFNYGTRFDEFHWLIRESVPRSEFLAFVGQGIDALYRSRSGGLRWLEQTPQYVLHYDTLASMFPQARFIHITRDGRHAVNSMREKFGWSFLKCLRTWRVLAGAGEAIRARNGENFLQVRFETIVQDPAGSLSEVFDFIGEEICEQSVLFLQSPINEAPGREGETPADKLAPGRLDWGAPKNLLFRLICGSTQQKLGYTLP